MAKKLAGLFAGLGLLSSLALSGCFPVDINVEKVEDMTGDGRPDVILNTNSNYNVDRRWIAVQQEDGSFDEAKERRDGYFRGFGKSYSFDGEIYREIISDDP